MSGGNGGLAIRVFKFLQKKTINLVSYISGKMIVPETNRLPFSRSTMKNIGIFFLVLVVIAIVSNNFFRNYIVNGNINDYEKEITLQSSISLPQIADSDLQLTESFTEENNFDFETSSVDSESITKETCVDLVQKLKDGGYSFSIKEQQDLDACINTNMAELSDSDLNFAKALNDKNIDQEQREQLRNMWSRTGDSKPTDKKVKKISDVIKSSDSIAKTLTDKGIPFKSGNVYDLFSWLKGHPNNDKKNDASKIADKLPQVDKLTKDELKKIAEIVDEKRGALETSPIDRDQKDSEKNSDEEWSASSFGGSGHTPEDIKKIQDDMISKKKELDDLNRELAITQSKAREAAKLIADGKPINKSQADSLSAMNSIIEKKNEVENDLKNKSKQVQEMAEGLKRTLESMNSITTDVYTFSEEGTYSLKGNKKKYKKKKELPRELTFKELEAIKFKEMKEALLGGLNIEGDILNNNVKEPIDVKKLVVNGDFKERVCIPSNSKFIATLASEIMYAADGPEQKVLIKLGSNIIDCDTKKVIAGKGKILQTKASAFSEETGIMEMRVTKLKVGKSTLEVSLIVGSADGTMGLKGDIYSRLGSKILNALVTSFSAGVLKWFSDDISNRYGNARTIDQAATGAALSGVASVGDKIATQMAQNLNNSPAIFFAPVGTPIILFPED